MRAEHWLVGFDGFIGALIREDDGVHSYGRTGGSNAGRWSARGGIIDIEVETGLDLQSDAETEDDSGLDEI